MPLLTEPNQFLGIFFYKYAAPTALTNRSEWRLNNFYFRPWGEDPMATVQRRVILTA
jgi:hypothetical protein